MSEKHIYLPGQESSKETRQILIDYGKCTVQLDPKKVHSDVLGFVLDRVRNTSLRSTSPAKFNVVARVLPTPLPETLGKPSRRVVFLLDQQATNNAPLNDIEVLLVHIGYPDDLIQEQLHSRQGVSVLVSHHPTIGATFPATWNTIFDLAEQYGDISGLTHEITQRIASTSYHSITLWGDRQSVIRHQIEQAYGCGPLFTGTGRIRTATGSHVESELLTPNREITDLIPHSAIIYLSP